MLLPLPGPKKLFAVEGNNGPICTWLVLYYFRIRTSIGKILKSSFHTKQHGNYTIGIASALRQHGLVVRFFTQRDRRLSLRERAIYRRAKRLGVELRPAITLEKLAKLVDDDHMAIVQFDYRDGSYFSLMLGVANGIVILPLVDDGRLKTSEFKKRWRASGMLGQCVIASRVTHSTWVARPKRSAGRVAQRQEALPEALKSTGRQGTFSRVPEQRVLDGVSWASEALGGGFLCLRHPARASLGQGHPASWPEVTCQNRRGTPSPPPILLRH